LSPDESLRARRHQLAVFCHQPVVRVEEQRRAVQGIARSFDNTDDD
jgi:hypothetical protein